MNCTGCGQELRVVRSTERPSGAVIDEYRCDECKAGGSVIANPCGPKAVRRVGRAVRRG